MKGLASCNKISATHTVNACDVSFHRWGARDLDLHSKRGGKKQKPRINGKMKPHYSIYIFYFFYKQLIEVFLSAAVALALALQSHTKPVYFHLSSRPQAPRDPYQATFVGPGVKESLQVGKSKVKWVTWGPAVGREWVVRVAADGTDDHLW